VVTIEVLGSGCANCQRLEVIAREAVAKLGIEAQVEHVTDIKEIMARGVIATPGLAVNGKVVCAGRVPEASEIVSMLATALAEQDARL
jgi:small redox-active disulfide protein 2